MDDFPGNSHREKEERVAPNKAEKEEKKVTRIAKGEVVRRRKPLGRRFRETFVGGDAKGVWGYVVGDVMIPAAKDMFAEAFTQFIERMIFGESRGRRSSHRGGRDGYVSYNRISSNGAPWRKEEPRRDISRRTRTQHTFDEIIIETRGEAEEIIDRLFDLVEKYNMATVRDLYEMAGIRTDYTDDKWGWTDVRGSGVSSVRGGYLLNLPRPEPLD